MTDLERAMTAAIRATTEARRAIYEAEWAMDEVVRGELERVNVSSPSSSSLSSSSPLSWSMRRAVSLMQSEGELRGYGELLSSILTALRRVRKEVR